MKSLNHIFFSCTNLQTVCLYSLPHYLLHHYQEWMLPLIFFSIPDSYIHKNSKLELKYIPSIIPCLPLIIDFSSNLSTSSSSSKLSVRKETIIPINSDLILINNLKIQTLNSDSRLFFCIILNKAKSARLESLSIKTHVQTFDRPTLRKKFKQLTFLSVLI